MSGTSSVRAIAPMVRRSMVASRATQNSLRGGASPPLPPFQRLPVPSQKVSDTFYLLRTMESVLFFIFWVFKQFRQCAHWYHYSCYCTVLYWMGLNMQLVENHDAVWDDGVAPEVALDFDCQHISKGEGVMWWLGGLAFFTGLFQFVKSTDPESKNPAVNRKMNIVVDNPRTGPPASD